MPIRLRKNRKKRGSKSCGYGSKKKHRGGGSRGGRGKAGIFKHKKSWALRHEPWRLKPKSGFSIQKSDKKNLKKLNLIDLEKIINGKKEIVLRELGFDKLLGNGSISRAIIVKGIVSRKAKDKIEKAGGKVIEEKKEISEKTANNIKE